MSEPKLVVQVSSDGVPIGTSTNPLYTKTSGGGGGGATDQGASNADAAAAWSMRMSDGSAFITPAKTGQFPAALGAATAANSTSVAIATDQLSTLATATKQEAGNSSLSSILGQLDAKASTLATESTLSVAKTLLGAGLPAALVSGRLDVNIGAGSITPSGTQDVNLTKVGGSAVALGQAANAASLPVALSSTQTGTAGTPASQVLSIQGIGGGTAVKTDGSAVTQPVSGTVTASTNVTPGSLVSETQQNCSTAAIILAAVASPKVRKIYNRAGNGRLFLRYGSAPTAETDCNFALNPGDTWEMPSIAPGVLEYAGNIYGLIPSGSASVNGLQVT